MRIILGFILVMNLLQASGLGSGFLQAQDVEINNAQNTKTVHIGVLAFRGVDQALVHWQPLADYLTKSVSAHKFVLTPVTLTSTYKHIESKSIDFLLTNPGHFVVLSERFGLSAISTQERITTNASGNLLEFGSVIFTRKDSNINAINDLKGRTIAAVSPEAFGGFQIAWAELKAQGIDAFTDLAGIRYMGFPQDAIVTAVLLGEVDAGIIRSGLLEMLKQEAQLDIDALRVLNANTQFNYPHQISSKLYPEWPFAALPGVNNELKVRVLKALLATQDDNIAAIHNLTDIWSAPLSYEQVRTLTQAFQNRTEQLGLKQFILARLDILIALMIIAAIFTIAAIFMYLQMQKLTNRPTRFAKESDESPNMDEARQNFETLTQRERQILTLICSGHASKSIAKKLSISPKTVEFHRTNLLHKTNARTTAHMVQIATRLAMDQGVSLG